MGISQTTVAAIRFGYGFHPAQEPAKNADQLLRQARAGARADLVLPVLGLADRRARLEDLIRTRRSRGRDSKAFREKRVAMRRDAVMEVEARVYQRALSPHGFFERLAAFWADHFAISANNAGRLFVAPTFEIDAIRPHVMGRFADMLSAVIQHPVMLTYLDQVDSYGPSSPAGKRRGRGLNENLAREILELHTMGVGAPYTQNDVRELAELLTGFGVQKGFQNFRYFPQRAEPGAETVLGKRYGGNPGRAEHALAFMEDVSRHKATARHLARKLAVHFVADDPDADLVGQIEGAWRRSGGHLPTVYSAMLQHPSSWRDFGGKIKRPVDLIISTLRALGANRQMAETARARKRASTFQALRHLNQPMFQPPGPDGWPEEAEAWITPQGLAARLNYASKAGQLIARNGKLDPRQFAETALGDALRGETAFAVSAAPDRWEGFAFALASPEFNRR
ncbi:MAG: DUF1800 domain-containing protein [Pseudomonadota bacterium]